LKTTKKSDEMYTFVSKNIVVCRDKFSFRETSCVYWTDVLRTHEIIWSQ